MVYNHNSLPLLYFGAYSGLINSFITITSNKLLEVIAPHVRKSAFKPDYLNLENRMVKYFEARKPKKCSLFLVRF